MNLRKEDSSQENELMQRGFEPRGWTYAKRIRAKKMNLRKEDSSQEDKLTQRGFEPRGRTYVKRMNVRREDSSQEDELTQRGFEPKGWTLFKEDVGLYGPGFGPKFDKSFGPDSGSKCVAYEKGSYLFRLKR